MQTIDEQQVSYYAIIPANVRYDSELTANAKLLYGELTALCNKYGYCWARNSYFSELYGVSKTSISKWISSLENRGYIKTDITYKQGTKEIGKRCISIVQGANKEKLNTPIEEKLKENNTILNNTSMNNTLNNNNNLKVISDTDVSRVKEAWNSLSLSNIVSIKGNRAKMLNARIKEYGIDNVLKAISSINNSKFLKGQNDRSWIISFDWFVKPNNFVKVLEGNYIDKGEKNNGGGLKNNSNENESRVPREEATDAYSIAKQLGYI